MGTGGAGRLRPFPLRAPVFGPALIRRRKTVTLLQYQSGYAEGWLGTWRERRVLLFSHRKAFVIEIVLAETDRLDWALKQFRRRMLRSGRFKDMKRKRYFTKPSVARKEKEAAASRRKHKDRKRAARRQGF